MDGGNSLSIIVEHLGSPLLNTIFFMSIRRAIIGMWSDGVMVHGIVCVSVLMVLILWLIATVMIFDSMVQALIGRVCISGRFCYTNL